MIIKLAMLGRGKKRITACASLREHFSVNNGNVDLNNIQDCAEESIKTFHSTWRSLCNIITTRNDLLINAIYDPNSVKNIFHSLPENHIVTILSDHMDCNLITPENLVIAMFDWYAKGIPSEWPTFTLHELYLIDYGAHCEYYLNPRVRIKSFTKNPDLLRVHKLCSESVTRYINAYDIFCSFSEGNSTDDSLLIRFERAIHELKLMGYITDSKGRKDHYERLVFETE
jgi:hypothetical protein